MINFWPPSPSLSSSLALLVSNGRHYQVRPIDPFPVAFLTCVLAPVERLIMAGRSVGRLLYFSPHFSAFLICIYTCARFAFLLLLLLLLLLVRCCCFRISHFHLLIFFRFHPLSLSLNSHIEHLVSMPLRLFAAGWL